MQTSFDMQNGPFPLQPPRERVPLDLSQLDGTDHSLEQIGHAWIS